MKRGFLLPAVVGIAVGLTGCGSTAHYVSKQNDGGVVAIPGNSETWPTNYRADAMELIRKHVGQDYEIVDEKDVPVGRTGAGSEGPAESASYKAMTNTTLTEYRITYRRKQAPAAGGSPNQFTGTGGVPTGVMPAAGVRPQTGAGPVVLPAGGPQAGGNAIPASMLVPVGP